MITEINLISFPLKKILVVEYLNCIKVGVQQDQLSHVMRKPTFWFPTRSDTNQTVQLQKMARCLKISDLETRGILLSKGSSKNFVFAYVKCWFSHDPAHFNEHT